MIYLITGVPGSGKTLYAVSTLVQKLAKETIKQTDGTEIKRRVVVDGIPDLVIDHELMSPADPKLDGQPIRGEGQGVWNWYEWCKPGDILVIDEVQRHWRPRGMGSKPPEEIKRLETHRHQGVDFVIITQNPMLIDQNARRMIGRHQHIRRLFGMARAAIYDWDGCSVDVHRTKSATTSVWSYPKSAYKLYKSSELHTKQKQKIPIWIALPILGIVGAVAAAPTAIGVLSGAATGKGISQKAAEPPAKTASSSAAPVLAASSPPPAASAPVAALPASTPSLPLSDTKPIYSGCIATSTRCACTDSTGKLLETEMQACEQKIGKSKGPTIDLGPDTPKPRPPADTAWRF